MKHSRTYMHLLLIMALTVIVAACASIGRPEGGPRDEMPPVFVKSEPAVGALNYTDQKLVIEFDENVQVKDVMDKVVVSPAQKSMPSIVANGRRVYVELKDTMLPNTTYTIDFSDAISDLNESNPLDGFAVDFSTGNEIDSLRISGMMLGYFTSSAISLLNFFATAEGVHSYMIWGMGNFSGVSLEQMPYFASFTLLGLVIAILLIKPLNALLLGNRYAENLGVNIKRTRNLLLVSTGILTAVTTAFCGPVSFIGLAVPHIARLLLGTSNHNSLLPVTLLTGSAVALLCNLICILPGESGNIPLNAVTPVLGAPVIIYVIINQRRIQYFN